MSVVAAILAAGSGTRFGGDKILAPLGGRPVWRWSCDTFLSHPGIDRVMLVCSASNESDIRSAAPSGAEIVLGGGSRQESSRIAAEAAREADIVLVHDAARPFVSPQLITLVLEAVEQEGAAAPATSVSDTIRRVGDSLQVVDRSSLVAMQTPQGARTNLLIEAHRSGQPNATDEMALLEALGVQWQLVPGEPTNFKITTPEDLQRARSAVSGETRSGLGYDVHPFSSDTSKPLMLGGIRFEGHPGLDGHSDADVILHAAVDAILGAAALGDIGQHFPNTDPKWKGEPSMTFLRHAATLVGQAGYRIVNLDVTVIAEAPKIMARAAEMRAVMAAALDIDIGRVSVKATTNEGLGSIGRGEGIAAFATATLQASAC